MKRREFIALAGSVAASPLSAFAQQPDRMRRIGAVFAGGSGDPRAQRNVATLTEAFGDLGWVSGQNIQIEARWGGGDLEKLLAFARELAELELEVILAVTTRAAAALQRQGRTIPIVFLNVSDPIGSGFVASLSRPGGNMTGFIDSEASLGGKWIELLKECAPRVARVALMFNPHTAPSMDYYMPSMRTAAHAFDVKLVEGTVHSAEQIEDLFSHIATSQDGAIAVMPDSFPGMHQNLIVSLAIRHRVPVIYPWRYMAASGGLISYGVDPVDAFRKAPKYVDRILKGEKVGDLPVQQPTKFELVINLKTAKALGLTVPPSLLARADEVIEYGLLVRESTVTIVVFGLLGVLASYLSMRVLPEPYARLARLFALMALLWVNFGFWVGSLWGDNPLEAWIAPDVMSYRKEAWDALQAWKAQAFFISRDVFSVVWALALAGVGAWGAMHSRRGAVNMAATFGGIHFYTQWFERLRATPEMVIAAGIIAVAIAFALWRYNQRQRAVVG